MAHRHPGIYLIEDDERRQLYVLGNRINLDCYEMTEDERNKWSQKLHERSYQVTVIRDDDETVH